MALKEQILTLLLQSPGYVSGQQMCETLGVSRAAVWKAVQALRDEGMEIEAATNRGYRLQSGGTGLNIARLRALLADHPWRGAVQLLPEVGSTNTALKAQAAAGAPAGTVLIAEKQTGGRGRLGRQFASPPGVGVYLSALLRPTARPTELSHLTAMVAVATCDAIEAACGVRPKIKWTNDLVLGKKKLVGILTELALEAESGSVQYAVAGIGINCNHQPSDFPPDVAQMATSILQETGRVVDRSLLAAELIRALARMDAELLSEKDAWLARYERDCITIGQDVKIVRGDSIRFAHAIGLDEDAALRVRYLDDGSEGIVFSGEVSVRGMYGYV